MFGRAPAFSPLVAQFDAKLNTLTWNDGATIQELTGMARHAPVTDIEIITACVVFRILMVRPIYCAFVAEYDHIMRNQFFCALQVHFPSLFCLTFH
jgi:hypothetical protein